MLVFRLTSINRPARSWEESGFVYLNRATLTKCGEVIFEVIGEMICFPRRTIMELHVDDVVRILICHFNDSDHVICLKLGRHKVS
jgi:hypothetical protein